MAFSAGRTTRLTRVGRSEALLLAAAVVLVVVMGPGLISKTEASPAPTFSLVDHFGRSTRLEDLLGTPVALTFLYTNCPNTCPRYLSNLLDTTAALRESAGGAVPLVAVVTVDPDRDTVEWLGGFAKAWPSDWLFLTGPRQELERVWASYGVSVRKQPRAHSSDVHQGYSVVHDAKVVLIDDEGNMAGQLLGQWSPDALKAELGRKGARGDPGPVRALAEAWDRFLKQCRAIAAAAPEVFLATTLIVMLPGLALPFYLFRTFLSERRPRV